jgi:hypothetical protein
MTQKLGACGNCTLFASIDRGSRNLTIIIGKIDCREWSVVTP